MLSDSPTEKEFYAHMRLQQVVDRTQYDKLTKEEKEKFNWLRNADFKVLWVQKFTDDRAVVRIVANDTTAYYRKPLLRNHHDYRDFINMLKRMGWFTVQKVEDMVYLIDSYESEEFDSMVANAYHNGAFNRVDLSELD